MLISSMVALAQQNTRNASANSSLIESYKSPSQQMMNLITIFAMDDVDWTTYGAVKTTKWGQRILLFVLCVCVCVWRAKANVIFIHWFNAIAIAIANVYFNHFFHFLYIFFPCLKIGIKFSIRNRKKNCSLTVHTEKYRKKIHWEN